MVVGYSSARSTLYSAVGRWWTAKEQLTLSIYLACRVGRTWGGRIGLLPTHLSFSVGGDLRPSRLGHCWGPGLRSRLRLSLLGHGRPALPIRQPALHHERHTFCDSLPPWS